MNALSFNYLRFPIVFTYYYAFALNSCQLLFLFVHFSDFDCCCFSVFTEFFYRTCVILVGQTFCIEFYD